METMIEQHKDDFGRECLAEYVEDMQHSPGDVSVYHMIAQETEEGCNLQATDILMMSLCQYAMLLFLLMPMYDLARLYHGQKMLHTRADADPPAKMLMSFSKELLLGGKASRPFSSALISAVYCTEHFVVWAFFERGLHQSRRTPGNSGR